MTITGGIRPNHERRFALGLLCLALSMGLSQGCSRSEPSQRRDASSPASKQNVPFHSETQASDNMNALPEPAGDPKQAASLPFRAGMSARIVPAGTLLTIQLEDSLSAAKAHVGDPFAASVAVPLIIDQDTIIEPGVAVVGRVESERSSASRQGRPQNPGYFRLTLSSITIDGRQLALQTSSLFARGTFQPSMGVSVQKGRRLTFRLTAPFLLDDANSATNHQSSRPSTE